MEWATIIITASLVLYRVFKSIDEAETRLTKKLEKLENQIRIIDAKGRYGDQWEAKLAQSDGVREILLCESELYNAKQKIWNKGKTVAYWQKRLEDAQELYGETYKEYEKMEKILSNYE